MKVWFVWVNWNEFLRMQIVSMGRKKFSADFQLMFRLLKLFLFIGSVVTLGILFTVLNLTVGDIFASLLAFMPTGWAILQVHGKESPISLNLHVFIMSLATCCLGHFFDLIALLCMCARDHRYRNRASRWWKGLASGHQWRRLEEDTNTWWV